jgi:hypothetical protein
LLLSSCCWWSLWAVHILSTVLWGWPEVQAPKTRAKVEEERSEATIEARDGIEFYENAKKAQK